MFAEYDRTYFPLVKVNISGIPSNNDFDLFLEEWLRLYEEEIDFMLSNDIARTIQELSSEYPWFNSLDEGARRDGIVASSCAAGPDGRVHNSKPFTSSDRLLK